MWQMGVPAATCAFIVCHQGKSDTHTHKSIPNTFLPFCCSNYHLERCVCLSLCVYMCVFTDENIALLKGHKKLPLLPHWESWLGFAHSRSSVPFTHVLRAQDRLVSFLTMVGGLQESTAELESNQKKSVRVLSLTLQQPSVMGFKLCCLSFIINSWKNGEKKCYLEIQPDRQHTSHRS